MSLFLQLADRRALCILLPVVEGVVLLRDLETEDRVADERANNDDSAHEAGDLRPLQLEMHGRGGIGQLIVEILIDVASRVGKVVSEVIGVHVVVMDEAATIETLGAQVEADIIPVGRPDFIIRMLSMSEVLGQWHRERPGFKKGHLTLEILVLACVVLAK